MRERDVFTEGESRRDNMLIYILSQSLSLSLALTYFRFMALAVLLPKPVLLKVASLPCFASLFLLLFWRQDNNSNNNGLKNIRLLELMHRSIVFNHN